MCNIVGLFKLGEILKIHIFIEEELGFYRDDGLAVIQSKSPRTAETTTKTLHKIFNKWGFKITIYAGHYRLCAIISCFMFDIQE